MVVFQGNDYAVAAVAGGKAGGQESVRVPDDTRDLQVVDTAGRPVNCRVGDLLFIPLDGHMRYLLSSGSGEDLAAVLRPARIGEAK